MTLAVSLTIEELEALVEKAVNRAISTRSPEASDVLTREQVAEILQCCTVQVVKFAKNDGLRGIKIGREWRFRRADVDAWFESHSAKEKK
jgi:excisionase family DNA binding protein